MEKTNLSKRVVAGTLALLTVFGSAPASLQGVFAPTTLTASAADTSYQVNFADAKPYITSIQIGSRTAITADIIEATSISQSNVTKGDVIVVKSSVPLSIQKLSTAQVEPEDGKRWVLKDGVTAPVKWSQNAAASESYAATYNYTYAVEDDPTTTEVDESVPETDGLDDAVATVKDAIENYYDTQIQGKTTEIGTYNARIINFEDLLYGVGGSSSEPTSDSIMGNINAAETAIEAAEANIQNANTEKGNIEAALGELNTSAPTDAVELTDTADYPYASVYWQDFVNSTTSGYNAADSFAINLTVFGNYLDILANNQQEKITDNTNTINNNEQKLYVNSESASTNVVTSGEKARWMTAQDSLLYKEKDLRDQIEGTTAHKSQAETAKTNLENERDEKLDAEDDKKDCYERYTINTGFVDVTAADDSYTATEKTGDYTYQFKAPTIEGLGTADAGIKISAKTQQASIDLVKKNDQGAFVAATEEADKAVVYIKGVDQNGDNITANTEDKTNKTMAGTVIDTEVEVHSADPFAITVDKNSASAGLTKPATTYDADYDNGAGEPKGAFVAKFNMPASANGEDVKIYVEKVNEVYTYTVNGTKVLASTESKSIQNAEAASFRVFYKEPVYNGGDFAGYKKDTTDNTKDKETTVEEGGKVPYGMHTFVEFKGTQTLLDETNGAKATLKKGAEVVQGINQTNVVDGGATELKTETEITAPGSYSVTYDVYGITAEGVNKKTLAQSFSIANPDEFTAKDVSLSIAFQYKDADGVLHDYKVGDPPSDLTAKGVDNGVADFKIATKGIVPDGKFTVTVNKIGNLTVGAGIQAKTDGFVSGSTVGNEYSFNVVVDDPVYGQYDIPIKWKLSAYAAPVSFNNDHDATAEHRLTLDLPDDKLDQLESMIYDLVTLGVDNKAAATELSYEYVEGEGATTQEDELDEHISDLPKSVKAGDKFTVYVIYNEEARVSVVVNVVKAATLKIDVPDSALAMTFGDKIELSKYTLTNTETKAAVTDVEAKLEIASIAPAVLNDKTGEPEKNADGTYKVQLMEDGKTPVAATYIGGDDGRTYLEAGTYIVVYKNSMANNVAGYSFANSDQKVLVVSKKKITGDMINIDPIEYTGEEINVVEATAGLNPALNFTAYDAATKVNIRNGVYVSEGAKKTAIGRYDATVSMVKTANDGDNSATILKNYEGTATTKWSIVNPKINQNFVDWNEEMTTMYDKGRIHFQIDRVHDDSLIVDNAKRTVKEFGVVIEKDGKFAAPTYYKPDPAVEEQVDTYNREVAAVETKLVYGNGYTTGKYIAGATNEKVDALKTQNYLVNIKVKDVDTGVWARPYILLDDGSVAYGTTKYINLKNWAKEELQLKLAPKTAEGTASRMADLTGDNAKFDNVKSGYVPTKNKFYAYAEFTSLDKTKNAKSLTVSDFGVIIDKTGSIGGADKSADANTKLVLGNGYIEGHYNPDNEKLGKNQYAASISPKDTVTGVWVRPYVDLGDGLVVYDTPVYLNSVSEYYRASKALFNLDENNYNNFDVVDQNTGKIKIAVQGMPKPTSKLAGVDNDDKVTVVKAGVIVDKTGEVTYAEAPAKLLLDSGYTEGKKTSNLVAGWTYTGKLTPQSKKFVIRTYVIYSINGVNVPVYGDVVEYNATTKTVTNGQTAFNNQV
ncbi:MAG: hypothetical protein J6O40_07615 [Ruminococcus sp.]|nr:hypothetical protein [Ruminococcus sp.]